MDSKDLIVLQKVTIYEYYNDVIMIIEHKFWFVQLAISGWGGEMSSTFLGHFLSPPPPFKIFSGKC
jgi:hypothetical protein